MLPTAPNPVPSTPTSTQTLRKPHLSRPHPSRARQISHRQACACPVSQEYDGSNDGEGGEDPRIQVLGLGCRVKKHQNKRFDKIVSLVNYTITSADKALKYVSLSSNFEAEFAYKLYLSDRENLMN